MKGFIPRRPSGDDAEARFMQAMWDHVFGPESRFNDSNTVKWTHTTKGRTAHAKPPKGGGQGAPIKTFAVQEEHFNYLLCLEWNPDTQRTIDFSDTLVAKPYDLRMYYQVPAGGVQDVSTTTWNYGVKVSLIPTNGGFYKNARLVYFDGAGVTSLAKTYYEYVDAPYIGGVSASSDGTFGFNRVVAPNPLPDGWAEDQRFLITACKPSNGVAVVGGDIGGDGQPVTCEWIDLNVSGRCWTKEIEVCDGGVTRYMRVKTSQIYPSPVIPRPT